MLHAYTKANQVVLSMLGVYANFTCPTNSYCEGGRCRCETGWIGESCDMRELKYIYTVHILMQHCWAQCMSAHNHSNLFISFFHAVASNPCGPVTCHNNGSCISMYTGNGTYSYNCLCRPSFTGENCSQLLPSESMIDK